MTLQYLYAHFERLMPHKAKGFTIGKGKKLYWYILRNKWRSAFRCLAPERETLGWPRYCKPNTQVKIRYDPATN